MAAAVLCSETAFDGGNSPVRRYLPGESVPDRTAAKNAEASMVDLMESSPCVQVMLPSRTQQLTNGNYSTQPPRMPCSNLGGSAILSSFL